MDNKQFDLFRKALALSILMIIFSFSIVIAQSVQRISVPEAQAKISNDEALLVCSYRDRYCKDMLLPGALLQSELEKKLDSMPKDTEIIFYCA